MHARGVAALFVVAALGFAAAAADETPTWRWTGVARVVAFGDVHGADRELVTLLTQLGVIDTEQHWSGGATHLVSVGDLIDRGPGSKAVLDLMTRLEREAPRAGGYVHLVLGNHEAMNLAGDDRYASAADCATFADAQAATPPADAATPPADTATPPSTDASTPPSDAAEVPGCAERRAALSPPGRFGAWLADHPALIVIDDTAFVHGGLPSLVADGDLVALNARFHTELLDAAGKPDAAPTDLLSERGPLWYRGTARCHASIEAPRLHRALDALHARRVVVGHTPTRTGYPLTRFGGAVVMVDTGMLAAVYHGHPSALVIEGGTLRVVVAGKPGDAPPAADTGGYAGEWASTDAAEAMLSNAPIERVERLPDGARKVVLTTADGPVEARFVAMAKTALRHEIAAYRLDRALQLGFVAPVAARVVDGKRGLLYVPDSGWVSERTRRERGLARPNDCDVGSDYALMLAFDALIGNDARSVDNLGYVRSLTELRLRDHGAAFRTSATPLREPAPPPALPPVLRAKLVALDAATLTAALQGQLDAREIKAVLARRDAIVRDWPVQ